MAVFEGSVVLIMTQSALTPMSPNLSTVAFIFSPSSNFGRQSGVSCMKRDTSQPVAAGNHARSPERVDEGKLSLRFPRRWLRIGM